MLWFSHSQLWLQPTTNVFAPWLCAAPWMLIWASNSRWVVFHICYTSGHTTTTQRTTQCLGHSRFTFLIPEFRSLVLAVPSKCSHIFGSEKAVGWTKEAICTLTPVDVMLINFSHHWTTPKGVFDMISLSPQGRLTLTESVENWSIHRLIEFLLQLSAFPQTSVVISVTEKKRHIIDFMWHHDPRRNLELLIFLEQHVVLRGINERELIQP